MNESYGRFAWIYDLDGNKMSSGSRARKALIGLRGKWR